MDASPKELGSAAVQAAYSAGALHATAGGPRAGGQTAWPELEGAQCVSTWNAMAIGGGTKMLACSGAGSATAALSPEQIGQPFCASEGRGTKGSSAAARTSPVALPWQIWVRPGAQQRLILEGRSRHGRVVAHDGTGVQKHAQQCHNADPLAQTHEIEPRARNQ